MVDAGPAEQARRASAHVVVDDVGSPALAEEDSHHLGAVLRLRPGEVVGVTDGRGGWRSCVWAGDGVVEVAGEVVRVSRRAPQRAVCVGFAPVKGDRNEWAVQKLTELGVDRIVLLRTDRGVVRWDERRAESHLDRLRRVARQALMQSRGVWLPEVEGVVEIASLVGGEGAALADPAGGSISPGVRTVLVGPEGGWSDRELSPGRDGPAALVALGGGVLRTETAAVAAGVLLTALRGGIVAPVAPPAAAPARPESE